VPDGPSGVSKTAIDRDHVELRPSHRQSRDLFEKRRLVPVVGVEERDERRVDRAKTAIERGGRSPVLDPEQLDRRSKWFERTRDVIGGTIVHDDDRGRRVGLRHHRRHGIADQVCTLVARDDDGERRRLRHASCSESSTSTSAGRRDPRVEALSQPIEAGPPHVASSLGIVEQPLDRLHERLVVANRHEDSGCAVLDEFGQRALIERHDRQMPAHRFEHRIAERIDVAREKTNIEAPRRTSPICPSPGLMSFLTSSPGSGGTSSRGDEHQPAAIGQRLAPQSQESPAALAIHRRPDEHDHRQALVARVVVDRRSRSATRSRTGSPR